MTPELLLHGLNAVLASIEIWFRLQDRGKAHEAFEEAFKRPVQKADIDQVANLIPQDVLEAQGAMVERCWTNYRKVLDPKNQYLPDDVQQAIGQVKMCICRALSHIHELNGGVIPQGGYRDLWEKYNCATLLAGR